MDIQITKSCLNNLYSIQKFQILDEKSIIATNISDIKNRIISKCIPIEDEFQQAIQKDQKATIVSKIIEIEQIRLNFPNITEIQKQLDNCLYTLSKNYEGNKLFQLLKLFETENMGQYIQKHSIFEGLKFLKFNRGIKSFTIEQAMKKLEGDSLQQEGINKYYKIYQKIYDESLEKYLLQIDKKDQEKFIDKIIKDIKDSTKKPSIVKEVLQFFNLFDNKEIIPKIIAQIALLWTIKNIECYKKMDQIKNKEERDLFLLKPHAGQIIAIFRMLGLGYQQEKGIVNNLGYQQEKGIVNNLIQVSTGEGKSLILAITSIILALTNCQVYCACYSKQLSERDYKNFVEIFEELGLKDKIHYGTFNELCEKVINTKGDIRKNIQQILLKNEFQNNEIQDLPIILLIDEVDVFFNKDFYGNTYKPITKVSHQLINDLTKYIWQNRNEGINFYQVKQSKEYQQLCQNQKNIDFIIDEAIRNMLYDLRDYNHEYIVQNDKIYYKLQDSISSSIVYGYKTMFAYYQEYDNKNITLTSLNKNISLNFYSGNFSYAEIPKIFKNIIGVTGTLKTLSHFEKKIIEEEYNINHFTYIPSIYENKLKQDWQKNIQIEKEKDQFNLKIINQIVNAQNLKQAILVVFENRQKLEEFKKIEQFDIKYQQLTEKSNFDEINQIVESATYQKQVTLLTKDYGRGTDFKCDDAEVNKHGVYVIQTFLSENQSEEIQIKGRTARQGNEGQFLIILYEPDLEKYFEVGVDYKKEIEKIQNMEKHLQYHELDKLRTNFFERQNKEQLEHCKNLRDEHEKSMKFRETLIKLNDNQNIKVAKQFILERNLGPKEKILSRTVFLMDATGSMSSLLQKVKNQINQIIHGVHQTANNVKKEKNLDFESQFEMQFVIYRDYDCLKDQIIQFSSWEVCPNPLESFIENIKANGGGDYEEAIEIALLHVNNQHEKQPISQAILIGDAPAKNIESIKEYRKKYEGEDYWNISGIPLTDYKQQLIKLQSNQIPVHTFYLDDDCQPNFLEISTATKGQCQKMELNAEGKSALQNCISEQILKDLQKVNNIEGDVLIKAYRSKMGYTADQ